jgi:putative endonuclease
MKLWSVYLVLCHDGTLYCGVSNDVGKRIAKHNSGRGAKYTATRRPVSLLVERTGFTKSDALKLEYAVKQRPRSEKVRYLSEWTRP